MEQPIEQYRWVNAVVTAKGYPAEVHSGYLAANKNLLAALPKTGIINNGWNNPGTSLLSSGAGIPSELFITWLSYVEKKFWKLEATLDTDWIGRLFSRKFVNLGPTNNPLPPESYNRIVVAVAPGGAVSVFIRGALRCVEVGHYQAVETSVDVNDFYDNPFRDNQEQFFTRWYDHVVPAETKAYLTTHHIPYAHWSLFRKLYNYRFVLQFYKMDNETQRHCLYLNAEEEQIPGGALNSYAVRPLPWKIDFAFTKMKRWVEAEFDPTELLEVFHEIDKEGPGHMPIDIIGDHQMKFSALYDEKIFPLNNVKIGLWLINRFRPY
ncbi:DUF2931 family protein [Chryseolinea soli]|uniref:DUF2931 family protein n=1 Tax=Chryseolinea soli TaxID=2321403 RepID=A0A385SW37_9BACT|nr:DUF2931 family protein [Chryseolinea soli]AYB34377.1 DUF2931 family protein [Chryseolinea soli]